ncbi:hypothetical protein [Sulfurimonas sp.]|uniref:hypothetical protein n=1 Tax=Sulfurimonas sp. TaxID=2022749 RepID=UPI0025F2F256|nr:hypothetical protein [Sulfurimonas sp.]
MNFETKTKEIYIDILGSRHDKELDCERENQRIELAIREKIEECFVFFEDNKLDKLSTTQKIVKTFEFDLSSGFDLVQF